ncbi:MAG: PIN domain-containing protein [Hyphomicrobiales bacterium]|nr:PIN domain-containing protein [Hyphomicrobiales bacterium]
MAEKLNVLWDTCVLYRWLTKSPVEFVDHISEYAKDAEDGKVGIFISSMALAELRPSLVVNTGETPASIVSRLCGFIAIIDTVPDIMSLAGELRDNRFVCSTDGPKVPERTRPLSPGDAIQLATGIWMREYAGVQDLEFHTFDEGKRKDTIDGKTVPMIGFHNWCKGLDSVEVVSLAKELKRKKPDHPRCPLPKTNPNSTNSAKPPAS